MKSSIKAFLPFLLASLILSSISVTAQQSRLNYEVLNSADRDVNDLVRDSARKPVEVLEFLGIGTGMSVLDVYAAGGYYTFILSKAVGPTGIVYAQNTERGLSFQEGRLNISQGMAFEEKTRRGNLTNVVHKILAIESLDIPTDSLDAIIMTQFLHDLYNNSPERAIFALVELRKLLKPGGVLGITDHIGLAGQDNRHMHRMEFNQAIEVAVRAGFSIVGSSDLLHNANDDHTRHVFHPSLDRNTDRFLLKLRNPSNE